MLLNHSYYPIFLNLKDKRCVVVGGGKVAERKVLSLLKAKANITVISPELTKRLGKEKTKGNIKHLPRAYKREDLKGAFLVIAATSSAAVNTKVARDAGEIHESPLLNVVDAPSECNFIAPSTVQRGPLTIAISTSGTSPAVAKAIRKELERLYGPEFAKYLRFFKKIRTKAMKEIQDKKERENFLKELASEGRIKMLREKGFQEARRVALDLF